MNECGEPVQLLLQGQVSHYVFLNLFKAWSAITKMNWLEHEWEILLNSQEKTHRSPSWVSYGMSLMSMLETIDHDDVWYQGISFRGVNGSYVLFIHRYSIMMLVYRLSLSFNPEYPTQSRTWLYLLTSAIGCPTATTSPSFIWMLCSFKFHSRDIKKSVLYCLEGKILL